MVKAIVEPINVIQLRRNRKKDYFCVKMLPKFFIFFHRQWAMAHDFVGKILNV
jgi:hypothetical protein